MASHYEDLVNRLRVAEIDDRFSLLADIASFSAQHDLDRRGTDLVIRALDRSADFVSEREFLWSLARDHGLFPYMIGSTENGNETSLLPLRDLLALEMHRPDFMDDVVFHRVQAQIYHRLVNRENVILSAPTSFGKSLIVDSLIATSNYCNVVLIVPTIALIDETRRRLTRFREYKVITHPGQELAERNLFVLTQERFLAFEEMPVVDFFFIDEFYKLAERNERGDKLSTRAALLNQALAELIATGAQYYMAGPSISSIDTLLPPNMQAAFFSTDYATVAVDTISHRPKNDDQRRRLLAAILAGDDEPTLVYCQSPQKARRILSWILEDLVDRSVNDKLSVAADWLRQNFHPEWTLPSGMERGVGLHHGRLPRWLSQFMVDAFNGGDLNILVCTNSLIEGVNTRAKRVIIVDKNIAKRAYDYFTFANIRGRAGRMFKHFVGTVHLFHEEPPSVLPDIDFPGLTQSDLAPDSLLISLDQDDWTARSRHRLADLTDQDVLPQDVLRANSSIDPRAQLDLAELLVRMPDERLASLSWSVAYPSYDQVGQIIDLIWDFLAPEGRSGHGATSSRQLMRYTHRAAVVDGVMKLIIQEFSGGDREYWRKNDSVDDRIELAFDFYRYWLGHNLPMLIGALDRIVGAVQRVRGIAPCNYGAYAARVESGFTWPLLLAAEEYGLPAEVCRSVLSQSPSNQSLDGLLQSLSEVAVNDHLGLHPFEVELLQRFQKSI